MAKIFKWIVIVLIVLGILAFGIFQFMIYQTKQHSPQETIEYKQDGYAIEVTYSRPFKKQRVIFGGLVPYGQVWRTGANEPTTFSSETDLYIAGQVLPSGKYTLWTIPNSTKWEVIFNSGHPGWGIDFNGESSRDPKLDVVNVTARAQRNFMVLEQFTIEIDQQPPHLSLGWDFTRVDIPLKLKR